MRKIFVFFIALLPVLLTNTLRAQNVSDTLLSQADLQQCIDFALKHQPLLQQSVIDEQIAEEGIKGRLADWYAQINGGFNLNHYFQLPVAFIPDGNGNRVPTKSGIQNNSNVQFSVSQNIFNRDVLLASRTAGDIRQQTRQRTISDKIDVVTEVSKAFYDVLVTQQQVNVLDENIVRLKRSLQDAYNQYQGGIVDKIDYKRAQIALNNTAADRKRVAETIGAKVAYLKQVMGYSNPAPLRVVYDSLQMERDINTDTLQPVQVNNRIEYQQLQTQQHLLEANLKYYKWSYLPNISAVGSYNPSFYSSKLNNLYGTVYPSSFVGLQLSVPIFQGGKRTHNIRSAELELQRVQWDISALSDQVNSQYAQALANYKGNLAEVNALRENLALAMDVYNTLQLQYNAGVKTYLDVIIAETDLRTTQLNYLNALNAALSSKLDLQRALGTIKY